jgi:hypothetical protein
MHLRTFYVSVVFWLPWGTNQVPFHSVDDSVCPPQWIQVDRNLAAQSFSLLCASLILVYSLMFIYSISSISPFFFFFFFLLREIWTWSALIQVLTFIVFLFLKRISLPGDMGSPCIANSFWDDVRLWQRVWFRFRVMQSKNMFPVIITNGQ